MITRPRAVVYCRVSGDAQERDGTSLETQERACLDLVHEKGHHLVDCIKEVGSGYTLDRDGLDRIRQMVRDGVVDVVVSLELDRLSREQFHTGVLFYEVEEADVKFEFVLEDFEDTAVGKFLIAAKAFVAEVEREKIAERTMRGKAERARLGRLPQGTGKGMYGYTYNPETGKREIAKDQANVVRRLFADFAAGESLMHLTNALNEEDIPTFTGSTWTPATIYHLIDNETYTGRTVYRRTKARMYRDPKTGKRRRRVEERNPDEWIEVPDATPAIITTELFEAVRVILKDPERLRRGRRKYNYGLSGRMKCLICGRSMVGQTLQKRFRYYRCRAAFAGPKHDRCTAKYVRAEKAEKAVFESISEFLSNPQMVLTEMEHFFEKGHNTTNTKEIENRLAQLERQHERLLRLFQLDEIDEDYLVTETAKIRQEKERVGGQLVDSPSPIRLLPNTKELKAVCEGIRRWAQDADEDDATLMLDAVQAKIKAKTDTIEIEGVIPDSAWGCKHPNVCAVVAKSGSMP